MLAGTSARRGGVALTARVPPRSTMIGARTTTRSGA
ncbi:MAG: CRISPR-associated protein Cas5, partial [Myxococcales bacterium]|nr:CRISPR-associated protein Cas5 [Myxococcales bacterium]